MLKTLKNGYLAGQIERILGPMACLLGEIQREPGIRTEALRRWEGELRLMLFFGTKALSLTHGINECHDEAVEKISRDGVPAYLQWLDDLKAETDWTYPTCRRCGCLIEYHNKFCGKCGLELELGNQFPRSCPTCHKSVWFTDRYCRHCGIRFAICEHGMLISGV